MNIRQAEILLALIIAARASAYLFSKLMLEEMGPFLLMAWRFLLAFALLAFAFRKRLRTMTCHDFIGGVLMGSLFFATMACELTALTLTSSANVSFLENTAIVLVPLGEALIVRALPKRRSVACSAIAFIGVALLVSGSLDGDGHVGAGEVLSLAAAAFYACTMIVTSRVSKRGDTLLMGVMQVGWIGAFGLVVALVTEPLTAPSGAAQWAFLAYLVVVCTGFGFTLQPMAQKHLPAERVGQMCALSPLVAAVLGVLVLGEQISPFGLVGVGTILLAIVLGAKKPDEPRCALLQKKDTKSVVTATQASEKKSADTVKIPTSTRVPSSRSLTS